MHVLLKDVKSKDWELPINFFFVDVTGKSESIKIDSESVSGCKSCKSKGG